MISPIPRLLFRVVVICLALFSSLSLSAQCNPPDQLPTITCDEAPLVCLQDACYETLNNPLNCCNGWCGANTAIHNPEYFAFIPTCPDVEIDIHVDFCTSGVGLQSAILDACPWDNSNVVACDPGTPPGGTMVLQAFGLIVGQIYWLVIDGSSGAQCNYTITFTECVQAYGFNGESMTDGEAQPSSVCQGYDALVLSAEPEIPQAHGYYWVLGWSGDTITSTPTTTTIDVPANVAPGIYDICVRAFSGCDTSDNEFCFQVEVYEIPPEDKAPETFCFEEFPFDWGDVEIDGPGEYSQTFTDPDGCFYDSIWMVEQYDIADVGQVDTLHCLPQGENTFWYEGEPYDAAGTYTLEYPGADINGCDSTAELNLTLAGIDAFVELSCENGEFVLTCLTQELIPANGDIEYFWYEGGGGAQVGDNNPYLTLVDGCYDLWVHVITPEGYCEFFIETFCFEADDYYPPAPELPNDDTLICAQAGVFFCVIPDPFGEQGLEYVWEAPFNVPLFQDGSECAEMDWSNANGGGQVCVYAIGECGAGYPTCFEVEIIPTPDASFTYTPDVCTDETQVVTFTGSASPNATIIWDFNNPTTVVGSGIGPYTVSWALEGNKVITLTVIEPGCDTAYNSGIVTVSHLDEPLINCTSTINSIFFDWVDVAGSSGYTLSLNGGMPFSIPTSEYMNAPLAPGTQVTAIVTAISAGPCPSTMDTMTCVAEDCPPPIITLSGQDSACLNNPTLIDLDAIVNGNPGTGMWSGPGITDPVAGIFDPKVSGAGQHALTYTVDVNGCPFNAPYNIIVFDSLTADFTLDPLICISDVANLLYTGNASGTATYDYQFGPANVVAGSGSGPYQLDWTTPGSKTVRLQVSENGCMSDIISRNTDVSPQLNALSWNCSPNTSGIVFNWTADPASPNQDTIILKGSGGVVNGNDITFNGLVPGDTVRIAVISYSAGPCPDRIDTFYCVARTCPTPIIVVDPVSDICLYPGTGIVNLQVNVTGGTGTGTGDWSGPGVIDVVNGRFDPNVAGAGAHQVNYHFNDDGCDFNNPITINVYDPPQAFISNTNLMITCTEPSIFLDGSGSSGSPLTYSWSTGSGAINGPKDTPTAEVTAPGVYQLLVTNATSGCKDSISVTVTIDANIPMPKAGPDKTITCDSTQFVLGGASTTGVNIIYQWTTTVGGNIVGPSNGLTVVADKPGDYTIMVRDTATGCQASDQVTVAIDTVTATINLVPGDTIDCNTPISTITSSLNEPISDYTFSWSTIDGNLSGTTTGQNQDVQQGGTYTLTIHNKRNGCETSADVFVPESDEIIDAVDVTLRNVKCFGEDNGALIINGVTGGIAPYNYAWSVSPTGGDSLTQLSPGIYILTVSDNNGCSFVETYTITEPPLVTLDLGPSLTVAAMDSVTIDLSTNLAPNAISSIEWSGFDGLQCSGCPSLQFIASVSSTISAIIIDTSGCSAEDSMRLTVIVPRIIFIPNVFSPNEDGVNDFFTISGRFNLIDIAELRIYDRWGNQVFGKEGLTPGVEEEGWDGTFNDEYMQPGVYVFVAKLVYEDLTETVSGNLTLIR